MPRTLVDFLIEKTKREEKYFKNYLDYSKIIKKEVIKFLGEAKVYIFGSILKKDEISQDIDILIVSENLSKSGIKTKAQIKLRKKIGVFSPFEFHFATPEEYNSWWKYFLKEKLEV